jgi:hypothetical protein
VSYDVVSLFTNIPTIETIEIILDQIYTKPDPVPVRTGGRGRPPNPDRLLFEKFHGLTRPEMKKLLIICTQESHFVFNGKFYDQTDGMSMGSPLGPLFANAFMSSLEKKHMPKLEELGVKCWLRFVDDTFVILKNKAIAGLVLDYLNNVHATSNLRLKKRKINAFRSWTS